MTLRGPATRLTILIKESDQWHRHPLYTEIVHRAHEAGLAGASVFRGVEGYGRSSHIHTSRILSLAEDLPCSIVIVDTEEQIRAFLPQVDELVTGGLVMVDDVEVVKYVSRSIDGTGSTAGVSEEQTS
jgi:PII-like signaling protein